MQVSRLRNHPSTVTARARGVCQLKKAGPSTCRAAAGTRHAAEDQLGHRLNTTETRVQKSSDSEKGQSRDTSAVTCVSPRRREPPLCNWLFGCWPHKLWEMSTCVCFSTLCAHTQSGHLILQRSGSAGSGTVGQVRDVLVLCVPQCVVFAAT